MVINDTDKVHSDITGIDYYPHQVFRIINQTQAAAYLGNGVPLWDIYASVDYNTGKPIPVFIFPRSEKTKWAYDLWCKRELLVEANK